MHEVSACNVEYPFVLVFFGGVNVGFVCDDEDCFDGFVNVTFLLIFFIVQPPGKLLCLSRIFISSLNLFLRSLQLTRNQNYS